MFAKKRAYFGFLAVMASFFIATCASCATLPATPGEVTRIAVLVEGTFEPIPTTPLPIETAEQASSTPPFDLHLPEFDQVVLTIPNKEPFSGREGDPRPDWLGWGAETFTIAPDGTFWIADTAVNPQRLLHYNVEGELLQKISLEGIVAGLYDLAVSADSLWVLDLASEPPRVAQLGLDGELLLSADIPEEVLLSDGMPVYNGVFNLWIGEGGELLTSGINGLYELVSPTDEIAARPVECLSYAGHTYRTVPDLSKHTLSIAVDGVPIHIAPPSYVEADPFLGFNPDGSFALEVMKETPVEGDVPGAEIEWLVHYFTVSGDLLGAARRWPRFLWSEFGHDLALGPDGLVYQLVSNPDHSVQIIRLGFKPEQLLQPRAEPTATPTPLTPLRPAGEGLPPDAGDEAQAREALLSFFTFLSEGRFAEASVLYGGTFEEIPYNSPYETGEDPAAFWGKACQGTLCLPVSKLSAGEQVAGDEFSFYVEFIWEDGTLFQLGACCGGNPAETPPVWQFAYPVKKIDGTWKVMRGPLFMP